MSRRHYITFVLIYNYLRGKFNRFRYVRMQNYQKINKSGEFRMLS